MERANEEAQAEATTTHSGIGHHFIDHIHSKPGVDSVCHYHIPDVEVCFKIMCVSMVLPLEHCFDLDFIVMFDWCDPSLVAQPKKGINFDHHFSPVINFENAIVKEFVGSDVPEFRIKDHKTGRVTLTQRLLGTFRTRFCLDMFPFDHQHLEIVLKTRHITHESKALHVQLANPVTWRYKKGHKLDKGADWLSEWDIAKFNGAPDGKHKDEYRLQITILRDSRAAFWRLIFSLSSIMILSFVAFGVDINDLSNRVQITLTMLLSIMAFKFILTDELPKVPYLTVMDKFLLSALVTLIVQGMGFWVVYALDTNPSLRYIFGHHVDAYMLDNVFLALLLLWNVLVHLWMALLMHYGNVEHLRAQQMYCKVIPEKLTDPHTLAENLVNTEEYSVYNSPEIIRPYPQKIKNQAAIEMQVC